MVTFLYPFLIRGEEIELDAPYLKENSSLVVPASAEFTNELKSPNTWVEICAGPKKFSRL